MHTNFYLYFYFYQGQLSAWIQVLLKSLYNLSLSEYLAGLLINRDCHRWGLLIINTLFSCYGLGSLWAASSTSNISFSCSGSGSIRAASLNSNILLSYSGSGSLWGASSTSYIFFSCSNSGSLWAASSDSNISPSNLSTTASSFTTDNLLLLL